MQPDKKTGGIIEAAVRAHYPTPAVLFEASALDRELANSERCWEVLLRAVESFASHYPAVLLASPAAMMELGRACLKGVKEAPGGALRAKAASLLEVLLSGVAGEVVREGAGAVEPRVPEGMRALLEELGREESILQEHGHLFAPLQALGRQVLMVEEDSSHPEVWFELLFVLTDLLLRMCQRRVEGEPAYDGRWDRSKAADLLEVGLLDAVRQERVEADLAWLAGLMRDMSEGKRPGVDVFLELSAYGKRDEREAAWEEWFRAVAARALAGELSAGMLRKLCMGLADWILQIRDHRFLSKLAVIVRQVAPEVAAANGETGLLTALDTFGKAIVNRLEQEAGRGDVDAAFFDLRAGVGELVQRLLETVDQAVAARAVDLGIRARTGPVLGHPVSREDAVWRLTVAAEHQRVADDLLLSLIAGFSLENILLRDDRPALNTRTVQTTAAGSAPSVGEALAGWLGRRWEPSLRHRVRAVLRMTPLSPFHVGGATTRAHLLALDPEDRQDSYLHDLKEQILSRAGPENITSVESVLYFWRTGDARHLDNLISPESLAALPTHTGDGHTEHIRALIDGLSRHVPIEGGRDRAGVDWLARMPGAFYHAGTLEKVAGFPGCSRKAVPLLNHLLQLYCALVEKYQRADRAVPGSEARPEELIERSGQLIQQREDLCGKLFSEGGLEGLDPTSRLELFDRELAIMHAEDRCLEDLVNRALGVLDRHRLPLAGRVLGHMLSHASLSGLGTAELESIGTKLSSQQFDEAELFKLLSRVAGQVASARNRLAERLQSHVEDSAQRLLSNPLSRPATAYQGLFEFHRHRGADRLAIELGVALVDDLLSADGSFLLLEDFIHRLLHLIERY